MHVHKLSGFTSVFHNYIKIILNYFQNPVSKTYALYALHAYVMWFIYRQIRVLFNMESSWWHRTFIHDLMKR